MQEFAIQEELIDPPIFYNAARCCSSVHFPKVQGGKIKHLFFHRSKQPFVSKFLLNRGREILDLSL